MLFNQPLGRAQTLLRRLSPLALAFLAACGGDSYDLVVYTSADQEHSEPLMRRFAEETGLRVRTEYDVEANKTVGLVSRLRRESGQGTPRCDVFWNNEIANTVSLAAEGLLAAYDSPSAADIPEEFRDPERRWTGFAARARILIVNRERLGEREAPTSTGDLLAAGWSGEASVARPLTGTTLTHAAVLYQRLGDEAARELWRNVKARNDSGTLGLPGSNGQLMKAVGKGDHTWGWTDTDDFNVGRVNGMPVMRVIPDQEEGGLGALLIPNTVAILADAPHRDGAEQFVDWLLSREVEALIAESDS
ncbi:MAG: extracellular solute-binding protein, partial [Planctomycetota bacterium]